MKLDKSEAKKITDKILSMVKADDATVSVNESSNSNLRFARNSFLTSGSTTEIGASITVWKDKKAGSASTSDLDENSLKAMVERAEKVASLSPVDRQYLPTLGKQKYKEVDGFVEATQFLSNSKRRFEVIALTISGEHPL